MILPQYDRGDNGIMNRRRDGLRRFSKLIKREVMYCNAVSGGPQSTNGAIINNWSDEARSKKEEETERL